MCTEGDIIILYYVCTIQACLLARELGISCTINPDHMINATIPDKLAIASFVYQLYSFFNENIPSAVTPASGVPMLPGNGMAEFDKITMAKLNSDSNLVSNPSNQHKPSSGRLKKYSRHSLEDNNVTTDQHLASNGTTISNGTTTSNGIAISNGTTTSNGIATELFPIVQAPSSNDVDDSTSEEPSSNDDNISEMFPRVGGGSAVKEADAPTNEVAANNIPDVVVNSPTNKSVLSGIRAKTPEQNVATEQRITAEEMTEDVVIVRRDSISQSTVPEPPSDNYASEDQDVINLDTTVNEITVS